MATSLADLLSEITRRCHDHGPTSESAADAAAALGHLNRALRRLSDHQTDPRLVGCQTMLADAGSAFVRSTYQQPRRLSDLAGVAADLVAMLGSEVADAPRWAAYVAITDTVHDLLGVYVQGKRSLDLPAATRLLGVHRAITDVERAAARRPPTPADTTLTARPVPSAAHRGNRATVADAAIADAAAGLAHYTTPRHSATLAEVLAITIAADTLYHHATALIRPHARRTLTPWRAVQRRFRPFHDGSRRAQPSTSPLIVHALNLHDACTARPDPTDIHNALLQLDRVADNLLHVLAEWAQHRTLRAYAIDLQAGSRYPAEYLAGRRPDGIIPAGGIDLLPATRSLKRAQIATRRLATQVNAASPPHGRNAPRRLESAPVDHATETELAPARHL